MLVEGIRWKRLLELVKWTNEIATVMMLLYSNDHRRRRRRRRSSPVWIIHFSLTLLLSPLSLLSYIHIKINSNFPSRWIVDRVLVESSIHRAIIIIHDHRFFFCICKYEFECVLWLSRFTVECRQIILLCLCEFVCARESFL